MCSWIAILFAEISGWQVNLKGVWLILNYFMHNKSKIGAFKIFTLENIKAKRETESERI